MAGVIPEPRQKLEAKQKDSLIHGPPIPASIHPSRSPSAIFTAPRVPQEAKKEGLEASGEAPRLEAWEEGAGVAAASARPG
ncbi:hypothetical protein KM043_001127 [Ampulex compressa]|nr:hypothetical protein KM043_001127 [Ampulex compressa]